MKLRMTWTTIALLTLSAGTVFAQPPMDRPPPPPPGGREPGEKGGDRPGVFDRESIKARLTRRLEDIERQRERLRAALERLEKGEEPGDVLRDMGPMGRRGDGMREGGREGDHGERPRGPEGEGPRGERRGGMPEGPGTGGPREGMGEEPSREEVVSVLREAMPELSAKIERLRAEKPDEADAMVRRWGGRVRELIPLRRHDPEMFQARASEMRAGFQLMEAAREARRLRESSRDGEADIATKRQDATAKVRASAEKLLDARTGMLEREMAAIEGRLKELRTRVEETRANREKRIDEAVERALNAGRGRDGDKPGDEDARERKP